MVETPSRHMQAQTRAAAAATVQLVQDAPSALTQLRGIAVPYNTPTDIGLYWESFTPGAFAESLAKTPNVPLLTFHDDQTDPIGVATDWKETRTGLVGLWRFDTSTRAQEAARLVKDGMLNFLSIRFQPDYATDIVGVHPDGRDHVTRTRARLLEVSLVSTPAYADAKVTDVRNHPPEVGDLSELVGVEMSHAFAGSAAQQRTAAAIVRTYVQHHGSRAVGELFQDAAGTRDGQLAVNLTLAAESLRLADQQRLSGIQVTEYRPLIEEHRKQCAARPGRRRRR